MEISWGYIATVAGAGAVTTIIVQLVKKILGHDLNKWYLRLMTYVIGLVLLQLSLLFTSWDWSAFALNFINAALVYLAATGEYHTIIKELQK